MTGVSESNQANQAVYERPTDELRQVVGTISVEEYGASAGWQPAPPKSRRRQQIVVKIQRKWRVQDGGVQLLWQNEPMPDDAVRLTDYGTMIRVDPHTPIENSDRLRCKIIRTKEEWRDLPAVNDSTL